MALVYGNDTKAKLKEMVWTILRQCNIDPNDVTGWGTASTEEINALINLCRMYLG